MKHEGIVKGSIATKDPYDTIFDILRYHIPNKVKIQAAPAARDAFSS